MIKKLYSVEIVDFDFFDISEKTSVEDRKIVGYFFNVNIKNKAVEICNKKKNDDEIVRVTEYDFECSSNQKYLYLLWFEYSVFSNGEYDDYYEIFGPFSNKKKCLNLKRKLLEYDEYKINKNKIFETKDGFYINKVLIDNISLMYF